MAEDCQDSLKWLSEHSADWKLDTKHVVLHGPSAGGHVALLMGFTNHDPNIQIDLILDEFGPTDLIALSQEPFCNGEKHPLSLFAQKILTDFSPVSHINGKMPIVRMIHGEADDLVPVSQSHILLKALQDTGNDVELQVIPDADHGLLNASAETRRKLTETRVAMLLNALGKHNEGRPDRVSAKQSTQTSRIQSP